MRTTPDTPQRWEPPPVLAGRYRILRTLEPADGGATLLAWDGRLRRWRVIDVVWPGQEEAARRLMARAESLARLEHPAVERVLDLGQDGPVAFVVRDRLSGSLAEHLARRGPIRPALAAATVARIAEGLTHAHTRGLIHGHVRPSLIRFAEDGGVVLTGFGGVPRIPRDQSGEVYAHLAPEQRQTWAADPQAEVYALGALLYTLLAGKPSSDLYYAESYEGLLSPIPGPMRPVLIKACAHTPSARFDGPEAFRSALIAKAEQYGTPEPDPPWRDTLEPMPPAAPEQILADEGVRTLAQALGPRLAGDQRPLDDARSSSSLDGDKRTPMPYVMTRLERKDPGFRDPFAHVDPADLPRYVDRGGTPGLLPQRPERVVVNDEGRSEDSAPAIVVAKTRLFPSWAVPLVAAALLIGGMTVGLLGWALTAGSRADTALVRAVEADQVAAASLASHAADPTVVEAAWFAFADATESEKPERAAAFVRMAEEVQAGSVLLPGELELAVERMSDALQRWEEIRGR